MNGPNNGGSPSQDGIQRAQAAGNSHGPPSNQQQQEMLNRLKQIQPRIHDQVQRLNREYEPPFYGRVRGFGRENVLAALESKVGLLALGPKRNLTDTEVTALSEHLLHSIDNVFIWKWAVTGIAAYMTYRGRKTYRFPFFTPGTSGAFSPFSGNRSMRFAWQSARFAAYYGVVLFVGEPVFQGVNFMRQTSAMVADTRLNGLLRDMKFKGTNPLSGGFPDDASNEDQDTQSWGQDLPQDSQTESQDDNSAQFRETEPNGTAAQARSAWANYRAPPPPPQEAETSSGWNSGGISDIDDDASPVASAPRGSPGSGVSSWDRVRQQSQYQPKQPRQQGQQTWERPQSTEGWGGDTEPSAPHRGPNDDESFAKGERERAFAKSQAQKDFDRMVERERSGSDAERSAWSRK